MTKKDRLSNIEQMENILNRANSTLDTLEESMEELLDMQEDIQRLSDYYSSDQWKKDFEDDEKGLWPKDLSRGVLSEDGIYDMLERYREMLEIIK